MTDALTARAAHSEAIRQRAEAEMTALGIDARVISQVVETFYERIARHPALGPVFQARLEGHWDAHLLKMKSFWSSVAFKTGAYGGKPVQAHLNLEGMTPELFPQWLALFAETLEDLALSPEARAWFMATAERIARSLALSLFYNPALDDPVRHA